MILDTIALFVIYVVLLIIYFILSILVCSSIGDHYQGKTLYIIYFTGLAAIVTVPWLFFLLSVYTILLIYNILLLTCNVALIIAGAILFNQSLPISRLQPVVQPV